MYMRMVIVALIWKVLCYGAMESVTKSEGGDSLCCTAAE